MSFVENIPTCDGIGNESEVIIVFVPALMGTELMRQNACNDEKAIKENDLVYVTPSIGLKIDTPDLSLPLQWQFSDDKDKLPVQVKGDIQAGMVLEKIQFNCCCSVTILDQYSTFCEHYRSKSNSFNHFYTFPYDWRRDLNETTGNLLIFLADIKAKHNGNSPQVVSHSMGCLVTLAALHTDPSLFHSAIFAGGNFAGGSGFYPTNTDGMVVGLNREYLSGRVCHTFPSMYQAASPMGVGNDPILRHEDGRQLFQFVDSNSLERDRENGEQGSIVNIDMYSLEDWKRHKLGPWSLQEFVSSEMEEHVKICLNLGKIFQNKMRNHYGNEQKTSDSKQYPPIATLVGDKFDKPDFFLWDTKNNRWIEWDSKSLQKYKPKKFVPTDGTVSTISASQPPLPIDVDVKLYKARNNGPGIGTHRDLLNDVEMIDIILRNLRLGSSDEIKESESTLEEVDNFYSTSQRRMSSFKQVCSIVFPFTPMEI
mmetsp:Transcript_3723/g.4885  ORF Transcript_3723/g.4885 Transcript_3723/m.4885 type:complete len:481 (+) Transcript_3723:313-1755(+)